MFSPRAGPFGLDPGQQPVEAAGEIAIHFYADPSRVSLTVVKGMTHALADEPGLEPAPQLPFAADVDREAVAWLRRNLG